MIKIRAVCASDIEEMLDIYGKYVINTTVTSEYFVPTYKEFTSRIQTYTTRLPWLVCTIDNKIVAYAYASPHRTRDAYQWSVETSIYVDENYHRKGIAKALYTAIFDILTQLGYYNIFVGITCPNERSMKFHSSMGFIQSGTYKKSMYKFGEWRDVIWMGKELAEHLGEPEKTKDFNSIIDLDIYLHIIEKCEKIIAEG